MRLKNILICCVLVSFLNLNGCVNISSHLESKRTSEKETILSNKIIKSSNKNKIDHVLKKLKGNDYFKGSNIKKEYNENILFIEYSVNNELGESDYINFWSDSNKKEVIISNAIYIFLIVHDMDKIKIKLDNPIDEEFIVNRNNVEEIYGKALEEYKINEESLDELINKDIIEELWCLVNS